MPKSSAEFRVGISGWVYPPWREVFYPKKLAQKRELEYASRMLNSIEINGSFYSLQRPSSYAKWFEQTPDDFVFAVKGGRYITHLRRLKDIEQPLANFFASGILALKQKLGPILWQFPPQFKFDAEKFDRFFKLLPRSTFAAAALAKEHDAWMKGRVLSEADADRPIRHAVEIRHESFASPEFAELLLRHRIALVFADTAGKWPYGEDVTADFVYLRLHGDKELYASGYDNDALDRWAARISAWSRGGQPADARLWSDRPPARQSARDVYVYFDNDVKVRAPFDAMALADRIGASAVGSGRNEPVAPMPPIPKRRAVTPRTRWPATRR